MCRPPLGHSFRPFRMKPSPTYKLRCPGCGYHFHTLGNLKDHLKAYGQSLDDYPDWKAEP